MAPRRANPVAMASPMPEVDPVTTQVLPFMVCTGQGYPRTVTDPLDARDRQALTAAVSAGARPKFLFFWGHTGQADAVGPWVLSQWYPSPFEVDGRRYDTAEHWMMAGKAKLFGDQVHHDAILEARSPGEVKDLGRRVQGFDDATWQAHRFELVVQGSMHKFSQDPGLGEYLRQTRNRVLVEASPRDRIWGIGLAQDHPDASRPEGWKGANLLGFALMEARTRLGAAEPS